MLTAHEWETKAHRWSRKAAGLFDALIIAVIKDETLLTNPDVLEALENYANDKFNDPDEWQRILNQRKGDTQ